MSPWEAGIGTPKKESSSHGHGKKVVIYFSISEVKT